MSQWYSRAGRGAISPFSSVYGDDIMCQRTRRQTWMLRFPDDSAAGGANTSINWCQQLIDRYDAWKVSSNYDNFLGEMGLLLSAEGATIVFSTLLTCIFSEMALSFNMCCKWQALLNFPPHGVQCCQKNIQCGKWFISQEFPWWWWWIQN